MTADAVGTCQSSVHDPSLRRFPTSRRITIEVTQFATLVRLAERGGLPGVLVNLPRTEEILYRVANDDQLRWRNRFYDLVTGPELEAIVSFGGNAHAALDLWENKPDVPTFTVPHPSNPDNKMLLQKWRTAIPDLRAPELDALLPQRLHEALAGPDLSIQRRP